MFGRPDAARLLSFLLLVAVLLGRGLLALLLGLILLIVVVSRLWSRLALRRFSYTRAFVPDRAFVGDTVELRLELRNAKLLGIPGLRVQDIVPLRLGFRGARLLPSTQPGSRIMERSTSLRPYEAVTWRLPVDCYQRGYYTVGPVRVESSDAWGLHSTEAELPGRAALIIYPRLLSLKELRLDPRHPLGDLRVPQHLLTDPSRTIGIRDYTRGDPFKSIHWGATARRGHIQTRVYEPATSQEVAIALDLDTFEQYWEGIQPELIERMISAAATVATAASDARWGFGLYANGVAADSDQFVRLPPSRNPAQLPLVLETLAKLVPYSIAPMPQVLRRIGPGLPWGTSLVVISAVGSQAMRQALLRLADRGRRVLWLYCGSDTAPHVPGVQVRQVAPDAAWGAPPISQMRESSKARQPAASVQ
jgi:uncharacterized protein (DUF58 family)